MSRLRVESFTISLDGFGAGPDQSLETPLGVGGESLHGWLVKTRTFQNMCGRDGGSTGADDDYAARGFRNVGAWILGRNMFGPPGGGPWGDEPWRGWWGDDPPYHYPVFVLTHHEREPLEMEGGTTFHFVTDGIEPALERARDAAGGKDVTIWGGAQAINQYLAAGLLDELELHIVPILLGDGARLFAGLGDADVRLEQIRAVEAPGVTHIKYRVLR